MLDEHGVQMHTGKKTRKYYGIIPNDVVVEGCSMGEKFLWCQFSAHADVRSAGCSDAYDDQPCSLFTVVT